jgi:hypothetical protein
MTVPITPADTYRDVAEFIEHWTTGLPAEVALRMVRSYCGQMSQPDVYLRVTDEEVADYRDAIVGAS